MDDLYFSEHDECSSEFTTLYGTVGMNDVLDRDLLDQCANAVKQFLKYNGYFPHAVKYDGKHYEISWEGDDAPNEEEFEEIRVQVTNLIEGKLAGL